MDEPHSLLRPPPPEALAWVRDVAGRGSSIAAVRPLEGSSFLANDAVDIVDARGAVHRLVLRRWAGAGWEATDRDFDAAREATILRLLEASAVPAPRLVAADPAGERADVPALLMTRLPGRPPPDRPAELNQFLLELVTVLEAIHSVDGGAAELVPAYRRYHGPGELRPPRWSRDQAVWRRAIAVAHERPPPGRVCFIHRDFHPGNTLWARGRLTGVVDWTYGSWGAAAIDLAHLRWNLALDYGSRGANWALAAHKAVRGGGADHSPYWDVVDVLDLVAELDPADLPPRGELALLEDYVAGVLKRL
jgi:aminoglycoside phosphotransferase (APT) family kinase protein